MKATQMFLLLSLVLSLPLIQTIDAQAQLTITLAKVSPGSQVTHQKKVIAAKEGMQLQPGDVLNTSDLAGTIVILQNDSVKTGIRLRPKTQLKFNPLDENAVVVDLQEGGALNITENPKNLPRPFRIRTRTATMGVRGTGFYATAKSGQPEFLCVCTGKVELKSRGDRLLFESTQHDHAMQFTQVTGKLATRLLRTTKGDEHPDSDADELKAALHHF